MELHHLRAFEVLAQELNFTRAAARLHLSQQALSAQVRELERRTGTPLFERTTRSVTLTEAGRTLLQHVPGILLSVGQALAETRRAATAASGPRLVVGLAGVSGLDLAAGVVRAFREAHPDVDLSLRNVGFGDASAGLASGDTDVALVWLPVPEGITAVALTEDPRLAVLPVDHPLARHDEVAASDLADEPFVWIDEMDARVRDYWTLADYRVGRPVRVGARISGFEDSWAAVRAGLAVAASPASTLATLPGADLVTRPVRGLTPAVLGVCRRTADDRALVHTFVDAAREAAGRAGG
ncbi:LysR family transcriptional regulator [Phycicoccus avicenniae]|uniref:LysR family transcriptional regulator n=1 Tax=Phycicoccus avicenniae TaxID=2828860 RepID=UPI003D2BBCD0